MSWQRVSGCESESKEAQIRFVALQNDNDVLYIVWKSEPAEVNLARSDEKGGRYQKAIDGYVAASGKLPGDAKELKTELEWAQVRANARLATTDPSRADDALAKLAAFRKANASHYSYSGHAERPFVIGG